MPSTPTRGYRDALSSTLTGICAAYALTALLSISFSAPTSALQTVPGSPCESTCTGNNLNFVNDTVCLDASYQTGDGQQFRECTTCLLNSTAIDRTSNISDVYWGLFNLRYTLAECMFAYPAEIVSISSPCQVTCAPLQNATTYEIGPNVTNATIDTVPNLDYCNQGFGPLTKINNCSFCYSFVPQQLFMANFLQALNIACRDPPNLGDTFYPNGEAIFNESAIPGPSPASTGQQRLSGLSGWQLGLAIALPIVGGALLLATTCFCCFKFTKKRRARMAASGRMSSYHTKSPDGTPVMPMTPHSEYQWPAGQNDPPQEMHRISYTHSPKGKQPSPGFPQTRWSHQSHHTADNEDFVPLSAEPRDDVGPGPSQSKDPFLHEQYFGIASSGLEEEPEPSTYVYPAPRSPDERGHFVR